MPENNTVALDSVYQFTVNDLYGKPVELSQYEGKVLLIVNIASHCGLTPQLEKLEKLYQEFRQEGFEVLAFPSNDFARQEPLNGKEIEYFCIDNYGTSFPIFEKTHVKGDRASDLFRFLANRKANGRISIAPVWNFHKYLINREGKVVNHFYSFVSPVSFRVKRAIRTWLTT